MPVRLIFGRDARVNALLGAGHFLSHLYQLSLPPLFIYRRITQSSAALLTAYGWAGLSRFTPFAGNVGFAAALPATAALAMGPAERASASRRQPPVPGCCSAARC